LGYSARIFPNPPKFEEFPAFLPVTREPGRPQGGGRRPSDAPAWALIGATIAADLPEPAF
jgi:hypothetical protein